MDRGQAGRAGGQPAFSSNGEAGDSSSDHVPLNQQRRDRDPIPDFIPFSSDDGDAEVTDDSSQGSQHGLQQISSQTYVGDVQPTQPEVHIRSEDVGQTTPRGHVLPESAPSGLPGASSKAKDVAAPEDDVPRSKYGFAAPIDYEEHERVMQGLPPRFQKFSNRPVARPPSPDPPETEDGIPRSKYGFAAPVDYWEHDRKMRGLPPLFPRPSARGTAPSQPAASGLQEASPNAEGMATTKDDVGTRASSTTVQSTNGSESANKRVREGGNNESEHLDDARPSKMVKTSHEPSEARFSNPQLPQKRSHDVSTNAEAAHEQSPPKRMKLGEVNDSAQDRGLKVGEPDVSPHVDSGEEELDDYDGEYEEEYDEKYDEGDEGENDEEYEGEYDEEYEGEYNEEYEEEYEEGYEEKYEEEYEEGYEEEYEETDEQVKDEEDNFDHEDGADDKVTPESGGQNGNEAGQTVIAAGRAEEIVEIAGYQGEDQGTEDGTGGVVVKQEQTRLENENMRDNNKEVRGEMSEDNELGDKDAVTVKENHYIGDNEQEIAGRHKEGGDTDAEAGQHSELMANEDEDVANEDKKPEERDDTVGDDHMSGESELVDQIYATISAASRGEDQNQSVEGDHDGKFGQEGQDEAGQRQDGRGNQEDVESRDDNKVDRNDDDPQGKDQNSQSTSRPADDQKSSERGHPLVRFADVDYQSLSRRAPATLDQARERNTTSPLTTIDNTSSAAALSEVVEPLDKSKAEDRADEPPMQATVVSDQQGGPQIPSQPHSGDNVGRAATPDQGVETVLQSVEVDDEVEVPDQEDNDEEDGDEGEVPAQPARPASKERRRGRKNWYSKPKTKSESKPKTQPPPVAPEDVTDPAPDPDKSDSEQEDDQAPDGQGRAESPSSQSSRAGGRRRLGSDLACGLNGSYWSTPAAPARNSRTRKEPERLGR